MVASHILCRRSGLRFHWGFGQQCRARCRPSVASRSANRRGHSGTGRGTLDRVVSNDGISTGATDGRSLHQATRLPTNGSSLPERSAVNPSRVASCSSGDFGTIARPIQLCPIYSTGVVIPESLVRAWRALCGVYTLRGLHPNSSAGASYSTMSLCTGRTKPCQQQRFVMRGYSLWGGIVLSCLHAQARGICLPWLLCLLAFAFALGALWGLRVFFQVLSGFGFRGFLNRVFSMWSGCPATPGKRMCCALCFCSSSRQQSTPSP